MNHKMATLSTIYLRDFFVTLSLLPTYTYIWVFSSLRGSNSRALKVAGLTTLACLLLGSQVFTAYMVFGQNQQIKDLQSKNDNMNRQLTRSNQGKACNAASTRWRRLVLLRQKEVARMRKWERKRELLPRKFIWVLFTSDSLFVLCPHLYIFTALLCQFSRSPCGRLESFRVTTELADPRFSFVCSQLQLQ